MFETTVSAAFQCEFNKVYARMTLAAVWAFLTHLDSGGHVILQGNNLHGVYHLRVAEDIMDISLDSVLADSPFWAMKGIKHRPGRLLWLGGRGLNLGHLPKL